jgi:hypothetical protein
MRCHICGNSVADGQEECPRGHTVLPAPGATAIHAATPPTLATWDGASPAVAHGGRMDVARPRSGGRTVLRQVMSAAIGVASAAQTALAYVIPQKRAVQGRVFIAEPAYSEEPDMDACKIITRILWLIMLLPFILLGAAACLFFRRGSAINLFAMLGVFRFLNPVGRDNKDQVPVRYLRIREDATGAEVMARVKGRLTHGNFGVEDLVTLHGRVRRGCLYATHGFNHRTASEICLARSYSWIGLVMTLGFILAPLLWAMTGSTGGAQ